MIIELLHFCMYQTAQVILESFKSIGQFYNSNYYINTHAHRIKNTHTYANSQTITHIKNTLTPQTHTHR